MSNIIFKKITINHNFKSGTEIAKIWMSNDIEAIRKRRQELEELQRSFLNRDDVVESEIVTKDTSAPAGT